MDFEKIKKLAEEELDKKIRESLEADNKLDKKIIESMEVELDKKFNKKNPANLLLKNNVKSFLIIFMYCPDLSTTKCKTILKEIQNLSIEECDRIKKVIEKYPLQNILDFLTEAQARWYCYLKTKNTLHSKDDIDKKINNAMKYMGCLLAAILIFKTNRIPIILAKEEFHPYLKSIKLEDIVSHFAYYIWLDTGNKDSKKNYMEAIGIVHNFVQSLDKIKQKDKDILTDYIDNNRGSIDALTFFNFFN